MPNQSKPKKKASKRKVSRPKEEMIQQPPPLPSIDELIADCKTYGLTGLIEPLERIKFLESPKGQKALERRERRLSRL